MGNLEEGYMPSSQKVSNLHFYPLTPERWADFERLFGKHGACGGCWCMWWRLKRSEFERLKGEGNRKAMKLIVDSGEIPGILAYAGGEAIGWCSVAPRTAYSALERSRTLKRVDDEPVWSVVCFFVAKAFRGKGVAGKLAEAATGYVREHGGKIVEAYPVNPEKDRIADVFAYTGFASMFHKAGFVETLRPSERRSIMRHFIEQR